MKRICSIIIALLIVSTSYGQIKIIQWRDSSGTIVPVKGEPIKVVGIGGSITGAYFVSDVSTVNTPRLTVGSTAGTKSGNLFVDTANVTQIFGTYCFSDKSNGTARFTVGTTDVQGSGQLYCDTIKIGTAGTLFLDDNRYIFGGTIIADRSNGTPRVTVGTVAGTGAGNFYADTCYLGYTTIGNIVFGADSFTTTATTDSVQLAANITSGFTNNSLPIVRQWNPAWSTAVDTAIYAGQVVLTGANKSMLVVTRVKSYTGNGSVAVKAGAQYTYQVYK